MKYLKVEDLSKPCSVEVRAETEYNLSTLLPPETACYMRILGKQDMNLVNEYDGDVQETYAIGAHGLFDSEGELRCISLDKQQLIEIAQTEGFMVFDTH